MATLFNPTLKENMLYDTETIIPVHTINLVEKLTNGGTRFKVRAGNQAHTLRYDADPQNAAYIKDKITRKIRL